MEEDTALVWIKWEKKFELGIPAVDEQHKHLNTLCNNLREQILRFMSGTHDAKSLQAVLSDTLRETVDYAITHFQTEEKLMAAAGYEGLEEHKNSHREFINKVKGMLADFDHATLQNAFDFSNFLYDWIFTHIAHKDKLYVTSVREYVNKER